MKELQAEAHQIEIESRLSLEIGKIRICLKEK